MKENFWGDPKPSSSSSTSMPKRSAKERLARCLERETRLSSEGWSGNSRESRSEPASSG